MIKYYWSRLIKKMRGSAIKESCIDKTSKIESGSQVINTNMGKYSFCGYDCKLINCDIGSFCSIADNVSIGGAQHPIEWVSTSPVFYEGRDSVRKKFSEFSRKEEKRTVIGHDVWIGESVYIKGGVSVGNGSVIGMGSIVVKDIGNYEIWAGNPARLIRKRFTEDIIEELNAIDWWDLTEEELTSMAVNIKEPKKFISSLKGNRKIDG